MNFSNEEKEAIFGLFNKCDIALLKVSMLDNGEKHIDKVYLDGREYDIPSKDLTNQLYLCEEAVNLIREKGNILKLSMDERNFVIRNHPAWMLLRHDLKFYDIDDSCFYGVARTGLRRPYEIWCQDYLDSMGEKRFYPRKNMKAFMVTYDEFVSLLKLDKSKVKFPLKKSVTTSFSKGVSTLYRGFFEAVRVKFEENPNLKVELNKYGYPEVFYLENGKWMRIDVSDVEGLNKLFSISPSPLGNINSEVKEKVKVKKRPTKGSKKRK